MAMPLLRPPLPRRSPLGTTAVASTFVTSRPGHHLYHLCLPSPPRHVLSPALGATPPSRAPLRWPPRPLSFHGHPSLSPPVGFTCALASSHFLVYTAEPRHRGRHLIGSLTGGPSPKSPRQGFPPVEGGQGVAPDTDPGHQRWLLWQPEEEPAGLAGGTVEGWAGRRALGPWASQSPGGVPGGASVPPVPFQQFSGRLSPPTSLSPSPPHPVTSLFPSPPLPSPSFPLFFSQHYDDDCPTLHRGPPQNVGSGQPSMPPGIEKLILRTLILRCSDLRTSGAFWSPGTRRVWGWLLGGPGGPGKRPEAVEERRLRARSQV